MWGIWGKATSAPAVPAFPVPLLSRPLLSCPVLATVAVLSATGHAAKTETTASTGRRNENTASSL